MDCRDVQNLLHPYSDGELDLIRHLQIEHHLDDCKECVERARSLRQLRGVLTSTSLYHHAPDGLRAKLRATPEPLPTPSGRARRRRPFAMLAAMAAGILVLLGALTAGLLFSRSGAIEDRIAEHVVAGHVRSLQVAHATDVVSSDRHTVKPWFQGKLPFTFNLPELDGSQYRLLGGKLVYLHHEPAAQLLFEIRKHPISVFLVEEQKGLAAQRAAVQATSERGFSVETWRKGGLRYVAISDTNPADVHELGEMLRGAGR